MVIPSDIVILSEDCSLRGKRNEQPQSKDPYPPIDSLVLALSLSTQRCRDNSPVQDLRPKPEGPSSCPRHSPFLSLFQRSTVFPYYPASHNPVLYSA